MRKTMNKILATTLAGMFALTAAVGLKAPVSAKAASETDASSSDAATDGDATDESGVDLDGTYHAYLYIQGPKYTFRDKWDNGATGGINDSPLFNQVTKQGDTAGGESVAATINDAEITGNGTYTASITGIAWPDDEFSDADQLNLIGLSTDIPMTDEIVISDIVLTIDGKEIEQHADIVTPESDDPGDYLEVSIRNMWAKDNPDIYEIGLYNVPCKDIAVTFTVSGLNNDNPNATGGVTSGDDAASGDDATVTEGSASSSDVTTEAAASADKKDDKKDDDKNSFPIIPVVGGVVVVIAAVVAVVLKKKK